MPEPCVLGSASLAFPERLPGLGPPSLNTGSARSAVPFSLRPCSWRWSSRFCRLRKPSCLSLSVAGTTGVASTPGTVPSSQMRKPRHRGAKSRARSLGATSEPE